MGKEINKEMLDNMSIGDRMKYLNDLKIIKETITKIQTDAIVNASKSDSDSDDSDDDASDGEELQSRGYYADEWVDEDED